MSSTLNYISEQITIYLSIFLVITGVIGGLLNLIIFLSLKTFRENIFVFYLIIMSFVNLGVLTTGLLTRLMISGFGIDWTVSSIFYCKFRLYSLQTSRLISFTCLCSATIEQYLATCTSPYWQQWRSMNKARILIIVSSILWLFEGIPCLYYYNHVILSNETICMITNNLFSKSKCLFKYYYFLGNFTSFYHDFIWIISL